MFGCGAVVSGCALCTQINKQIYVCCCICKFVHICTYFLYLLLWLSAGLKNACKTINANWVVGNAVGDCETKRATDSAAK